GAITLFAGEALDPAAPEPGSVQLTYLGADGLPGGGDDAPVAIASVEVLHRIFNIVPANALPYGVYELQVAGAAVRDLSGNEMEEPYTLRFGNQASPPFGSVAWVGLDSTDWNDARNWRNGRLPTNSDSIFVNPLGLPATLSNVIIRAGSGIDVTMLN